MYDSHKEKTLKKTPTKEIAMLTLRTTLEPDGHIALPPTLRQKQPVSVLVTFIDAPPVVQTGESAATTLALLRSPAFQSLSKADPQEVERRIANLRNDWKD